MKNLLKALGMSLFFIPILFIFSSCGKSSGGTGGNGPVGPNPTPTAPSWSKAPVANPATIFGLGLGTTTISAEAVNATSMSIVRVSDGSTVKTVSGGSISYDVTGLVSADSYRVVAKNDKGSISNDVPILLYPDNVTKIVYTPAGKTGIWKATSERFKDPGGPWIVWNGYLCESYKFYITGKFTFYASQCGGSYDSSEDWSLVNNTLNVSITAIPYTATFSVDGNTMIRTMEHPNTHQLVETTLTKF